METNTLAVRSQTLDDYLNVLAEEHVSQADVNLNEEDRALAIQRAKTGMLVRAIPPSLYAEHLQESVMAEALARTQGMELTEIQREALTYDNAISILSELEAHAEVNLGEILAAIEGEGLFEELPEGVLETFDQYVEAKKISPTRAYNLKNLVRVVFPFLRLRMNEDPMAIYKEIGSGKFDRIIGLLRAIIDPTQPRLHEATLRKAQAVRALVLETHPDVGDVEAECVRYVLEEARMHSVTNFEIAMENIQEVQEEEPNTVEAEPEERNDGPHFTVTARPIHNGWDITGRWDRDTMNWVQRRLGNHLTVIQEEN